MFLPQFRSAAREEGVIISQRRKAAKTNRFCFLCIFAPLRDIAPHAWGCHHFAFFASGLPAVLGDTAGLPAEAWPPPAGPTIVSGLAATPPTAPGLFFR